MKIIDYKFHNGTNKTFEVKDHFYKEYKEMEKEEKRVVRKETRRHISLDKLNEQGMDFQSNEPPILDMLIAKETNTKLQKAISKLSPVQQELIYKVFYQEISLTDIAKEKGISKSAITQQMQVIYKHLRKFLENS